MVRSWGDQALSYDTSNVYVMVYSVFTVMKLYGVQDIGRECRDDIGLLKSNWKFSGTNTLPNGELAKIGLGERCGFPSLRMVPSTTRVSICDSFRLIDGHSNRPHINDVFKDYTASCTSWTHLYATLLRYNTRSTNVWHPPLTKRAVLNLRFDPKYRSTYICATDSAPWLAQHVPCPSRKHLLSSPECLKGKARSNLDPLHKSTPATCPCASKCRVRLHRRSRWPISTSTTPPPQSSIFQQRRSRNRACHTTKRCLTAIVAGHEILEQ